MTCCGSEANIDQDAIRANKAIDNQLEKDKKSLPFRLLLLGAGESGKSTIAKQMKLIYLNGFTAEEKALFVTAIHTNIYQSMRNMIQASERLGIPLNDIQPAVLKKFDSPFLESRITPEFGREISQLWKSPSIQQIYTRRGEYQLNDSTKYYMDDIARLTTPDYTPTDIDVLRSRVQTTGIIETEFTIDDHKFIMVDVGGQRSERKKWIHCFEDVTAVLFCVGMSEFDQVLYEDGTTNRMHEALKLFHEICQSKWFTYTAIILFLNKSDLFAEKIQAGKSIKQAFKDYTGKDTFEDSAKFVQAKFCAVDDPLTGRRKDIYPHITCATDTNNVRVVFNAIKDFITAQALEGAGLLV